MNKQLQLVCFDMDGTLIRNTNSVEYLCIINSAEKSFMEIEKKEESNEVTWIEADHLKARLVKGLGLNDMVFFSLKDRP